MVAAAPADELGDRYLVQPILKAVQVLQLVCEAPQPVSLNEIVRMAELPKTTVFRYLRTLAALGFVEHDDELDRYRPGIGLWRLSHGAGPYEALRNVARPSMKRLRERFNETINLGVLSGGEVFYLDVLESEQSLRMQATVGSTDPLYSTALGKIFLAFCPADRREHLIPPGLERHTANTITDRAKLLEQLAVIRTTGYAIEVGENEDGSYCIAAPIFDHRGVATAAISLSAPISRFDEGSRQVVCAALIEAGREISGALDLSKPVAPSEVPRRRAG